MRGKLLIRMTCGAIAVGVAGCSNNAIPAFAADATREDAAQAASDCSVENWSWTADYASFDGLPDGERFFFHLDPLPSEIFEYADGTKGFDVEERAERTLECLKGSFARQHVVAKFGSLETGGSLPDGIEVTESQ